MDKQYETKTVVCECPKCKEQFDQDIEIIIYKPDLDVDAEAK